MADVLPRALATEMRPDEESFLRERLSDVVALNTLAGGLDDAASEELNRTEVLIPFIHTQIGAAELDRLPALRLIATRSTGLDHLDVAACQARDVAIANVPGYGENAVAEHAFALLLSISRKIHLAQERTRQGDFTLEGLRGFDLYGKTFGVVGAGAIGLHAIRIAKGFGMRVLAYDTKYSALLSEVIGFRYTSLDEVLAESDVLSLHAPAIPATYHLINRESLGKMKRGAVLINTARGSLVATEDLTWALDAGILAGAGLDALEGEEFLQREEELLSNESSAERLRLLLANHILQRRANVVITPHIAFNTDEALRRILETTIQNVRAFLAGEPEHLVGPRSRDGNK